MVFVYIPSIVTHSEKEEKSNEKGRGVISYALKYLKGRRFPFFFRGNINQIPLSVPCFKPNKLIHRFRIFFMLKEKNKKKKKK